MRFLKKKWLWFIGGALLLLLALFFVGKTIFGAPQARAATQTGQVSVGDIESLVVSSAALQPAADLSLTFGSGGTLETLNVKPGDKVEKGQTLAAIDTSDLALSVMQAEANLSSAQAKLDTVKAGSTAKDIANAEGSLKSAKAKLNSLQEGPTSSDLASAEASLKSAKAKLADVMDGASVQDLADAEGSVKSAQAKLDDLKAGNRTEDIAAAQANLDSAKAKLAALKAGPTAADKSAAQLKVTQAESSLEKTKSSSSLSKQQAEVALAQAANTVRNAQDKLVEASTIKGDKPIVNPDGSFNSDATQAQINTYNAAVRTLQDAEANMRKAQLSLEDARLSEVQNVNLAQRQLDDAKLQLQDALDGASASDLASAEASVVSAQNNLDKLKEPPSAADLASAQASVDQAKNKLTTLKTGPTAADIASAQANVAQAQNSLDKLKAPASQSDVIQAQASVDQAQNNLNALKAGPTASELSQAEASVDQSKASLESAKLKLNNAALVAPFAGTIAGVPVTLGQSVGASTVIAELVDDNSYHIDVNVGEADVTKVKPGQPVNLTFDALPDSVYTGTVTYVAPKATTQSGVVSYLATVTIDPKAAGSALRPGMSATASVIVERHTNVISVPNRAVRTEGRQKIVYVVGPNESQIRVPVEVGLSNGTSTEITGQTPLRDGDSLVLNTVTSTSTGTRGFGGGPQVIPFDGR